MGKTTSTKAFVRQNIIRRGQETSSLREHDEPVFLVSTTGAGGNRAVRRKPARKNDRGWRQKAQRLGQGKPGKCRTLSKADPSAVRSGWRV
jgi:hypothetical protein